MVPLLLLYTIGLIGHCFTRIKNIKLSVSSLICLILIQWREKMVNVVMYPGTEWNISIRRFNLHTQWCECHCWVVLSHMFSVIIWYVRIPCKQLSSASSSGTSTGVPTNLFQLVKGRNIPKCFARMHIHTNNFECAEFEYHLKNFISPHFWRGSITIKHKISCKIAGWIWLGSFFR